MGKLWRDAPWRGHWWLVSISCSFLLGYQINGLDYGESVPIRCTIFGPASRNLLKSTSW
jgi:hypothetical protein